MSKAGTGHTQQAAYRQRLLTYPRRSLGGRKLGECLHTCAHTCTMLFQGDFWKESFIQFLCKPQLFLQAPRSQQMVPAKQAPESLNQGLCSTKAKSATEPVSHGWGRNENEFEAMPFLLSGTPTFSKIACLLLHSALKIELPRTPNFR